MQSLLAKTKKHFPNGITFLRLLLVPVIFSLILIDGPKLNVSIFWLYVICGLSDFFDGYLARKWQQSSALGRVFDPIADKILIVSILLALAAKGVIANWSMIPAFVVLCREMLVSGLREFLSEVRVRLPVSYLAKWKTAMQIVALGFLLYALPSSVHQPLRFLWAHNIGLVLLWIAAFLTMITGYDYLRSSTLYLMEGD